MVLSIVFRSYHAKISCIQISTIVYNQVFIHTAEWTEAMQSEEVAKGLTRQYSTGSKLRFS